MFATQIVLLAATAVVAPLASNAAPILSGMFSKRADSNVQLAQGTNFFFNGLPFESQCTPGQVACMRGNFATCSAEANWEVTPCLNNTSCFAVPNANNNIDVKCMSETDANNAITQAGGQGGVAVDFQVTEAPFPDPNVSTDPNAPVEPTPTDATPTGSDEAQPTETCIPEDGSDDGSDGSDNNDGSDGSDDGSNGDGSEATPTGDVAETGAPTPTPTDGETCTEEPEETETITLILVPNPTESGAYITSTFTGDFPEATDGPAQGNDSDGSNGDNNAPTPTDAPTEATPTETCTESATEGGNGEGQGEDDGEYTYSDSPSDAPSEAPTEAAPTDAPVNAAPTTTIQPTTYTAPAPSVPSDIVVVGTHLIPVAPTKRSIKFRRD